MPIIRLKSLKSLWACSKASLALFRCQLTKLKPKWGSEGNFENHKEGLLLETRPQSSKILNPAEIETIFFSAAPNQSFFLNLLLGRENLQVSPTRVKQWSDNIFYFYFTLGHSTQLKMVNERFSENLVKRITGMMFLGGWPRWFTTERFWVRFQLQRIQKKGWRKISICSVALAHLKNIVLASWWAHH